MKIVYSHKALGITALSLLILIGIAGASPYAYIAGSDNKVFVIDTATNNITDTVNLGAQFVSPYGVAVTPDEKKAYVTNSAGEDVYVIYTTNNTITTVKVGKSPYGVAVTPDGKKVYVANQGSDTVSVIDTNTDTVIATVNGLALPEGIAVSPDGMKVYVANTIAQSDRKVSVIDTVTNNVVDTVDVGINPEGVAVSPDGKKVFVTDLTLNIVSVIDTTTKATATVNVGDHPIGVAVSPDGTKVYVANQNSNNVSVIDTSTNRVIETMFVGKGPKGVAVTPDGKKVFITSESNNSVSIIDTDSNKVTATMDGLKGARSIGQFIVPFRGQLVFPVANFNANPTSGYAPLIVQFTDSSQNAAGWSWDFGDGATSNEPNPSHTYNTEGTYNVNLVVSNANGTSPKSATITVQSQGSSSGGSSSGGSSSGGSSSSSSGGGGGGGGAGGSPEPQSNVEVKELSQTFIGNGQSVKFDFPQKVTPVEYISFDSKKTAGKTTTIVEMLKGKSTLVSELPSDEVYKFLNIWVGNNGFATPKNIENAIVNFKVEKSWIKDKNIDQSSITLNRYSDNAWDQLPTTLSSEDNDYLYLTAQTPGFSPFAITGKSASENIIEPNKLESYISVNSSANPSTLGQSITLVAIVGTMSNGTEKPSGTVTFMDGSTFLGTTNVASGQANLTNSTLSVGSHSIIAEYSGDSKFKSNKSSAFLLTVQEQTASNFPASGTKDDKNNYLVFLGFIVTLLAALIKPLNLNDFTISVDPISIKIGQKDTRSSKIKVDFRLLYRKAVTLKAESSSPLMHVNFEPKILKRGNKSASTINVSTDNITPGEYSIKIIGTGADGKERDCKLFVEVTSIQPEQQSIKKD